MTAELTDQPTPQNDKAPAKAAGLPKLVKPYLFLTAYYGALAFVGLLVFGLNPHALEYLPVGGAADFGAVGQAALEPARERMANAAASVETTLSEGVRLAVSIIASFLLMLPVTWICMGARRRKDVSQSFIQTILVLPMVITGVVHIVHNSLALAFSLAGIVAGVRFRHTLKDSAETTYLFTAIAVGLSCGISAIEVAAIISVFFNYTVLGLWATEYGGGTTGKQSFSREWMSKDDVKESRKRDRAEDPDDDD